MVNKFPCLFHKKTNCDTCNISFTRQSFSYDLHTLMLEYNISSHDLIKLAKKADVVLHLNGLITKNLLETAGVEIGGDIDDWPESEISFLLADD